jgi:hypothetical protein
LFLFVLIHGSIDITAQRPAAQPRGHFRIVITILAGIPKLQYSILSLSLGQAGCSRVLARLYSLPPFSWHFRFFDNALLEIGLILKFQ